jgi:hypothetical protein
MKSSALKEVVRKQDSYEGYCSRFGITSLGASHEVKSGSKHLIDLLELRIETN